MLSSNSHKITVTIHSARSLYDTNLFCKMDPYVKVSIGGQEYKSKTAKNQGKTPMWDQTFQFSYVGETSIRFKLFDKDTVNDDYIGMADLALAPIANTPNKRYAAEIELTRAKGKFAGFLKVTIVFDGGDAKPCSPYASTANTTTASSPPISVPPSLYTPLPVTVPPSYHFPPQSYQHPYGAPPPYGQAVPFAVPQPNRYSPPPYGYALNQPPPGYAFDNPPGYGVGHPSEYGLPPGYGYPDVKKPHKHGKNRKKHKKRGHSSGSSSSSSSSDSDK